MYAVAADWVWLPDGPRAAHAVVLNGAGVVTEVRPARAGERLRPGLLLPGLINAHTHLELSHLQGQVPGTGSLPEWVASLVVQARDISPSALAEAARALRAAGCAAVVDVCNEGSTAAQLAAAGLRGVVQVELLGMSPDLWATRLDQALRARGAPGVRVRLTAHAPVSCDPELLRTALSPAPDAPMATFHCDESTADALLLRDRAGPWADLLDAWDRPWRVALGRAESGVDLLDGLGLLGPELALVHLTAATELDLDRVAATGTRAVLCPRSNRHIEGGLPDLPGMVRRGIPLALGTDSLASCPDLDVLADAAVLAEAYPQVEAAVLVSALTSGGAAVVGDDELGRLAPGARPGVLHVRLPATDDPARTLLSGERWPRGWTG